MRYCSDCGRAMPEHAYWCETEHFRGWAEKAWDEGYRSGHSNAMRQMSDEPNAPTSPNPYSKDNYDFTVFEE